MSSSNPTLAGRRIAITRAREQASELSAKLAALGAEVIELPLIRVTKHIDKQNLADVLLELGSYDWIVFTSTNGVRYFFEEFNRLFDDIRSLGLLRFACIGDATASAIRELHLKVECQPKTATAEALAEALIATGSLDSAKAIVITGNLNRDVLITKLEGAGAIVDQLQVYQTEQTDLTQEPAVADFRAKGADAILFASSSAAQARSIGLAASMPAGPRPAPISAALNAASSPARTPRICTFARLVSSSTPPACARAASARARVRAALSTPPGRRMRHRPPSRAATTRTSPGHAEGRTAASAARGETGFVSCFKAIPGKHRARAARCPRGRRETAAVSVHPARYGFARIFGRQVSWLAGRGPHRPSR